MCLSFKTFVFSHLPVVLIYVVGTVVQWLVRGNSDLKVGGSRFPAIVLFP